MEKNEKIENQVEETEETAALEPAQLEQVTGGWGRYEGAATGQSAEEFVKNAPPV